MMQRVKLQPAHHVCDLIKRSVVARKRSPNLCRGVVSFVTDSIDQKIDALLRGHLFQMKAKAKDDACAAVHPPEQCSDAVFGSLVKTHIPHQKLPIECPTFY